MRKYIYIAVQIEEHNTFYADCIKISCSDNLLSKLKIKNIVSATIFQSKKQSEELAEFWNDCYKQNGRYMFDYPYCPA